MASNDPRIVEARSILAGGGQRQDSLKDQLDDVILLATAAGCYDAVDFIVQARSEAFQLSTAP